MDWVLWNGGMGRMGTLPRVFRKDVEAAPDVSDTAGCHGDGLLGKQAMTRAQLATGASATALLVGTVLDVAAKETSTGSRWLLALAGLMGAGIVWVKLLDGAKPREDGR
jgi:hypothetical protein